MTLQQRQTPTQCGRSDPFTTKQHCAPRNTMSLKIVAYFPSPFLIHHIFRFLECALMENLHIDKTMERCKTRNTHEQKNPLMFTLEKMQSIEHIRLKWNGKKKHAYTQRIGDGTNAWLYFSGELRSELWSYFTVIWQTCVSCGCKYVTGCSQLIENCSIRFVLSNLYYLQYSCWREEMTKSFRLLPTQTQFRHFKAYGLHHVGQLYGLRVFMGEKSKFESFTFWHNFRVIHEQWIIGRVPAGPEFLRDGTNFECYFICTRVSATGVGRHIKIQKLTIDSICS